jgi:hypothetical protein
MPHGEKYVLNKKITGRKKKEFIEVIKQITQLDVKKLSSKTITIDSNTFEGSCSGCYDYILELYQEYKISKYINYSAHYFIEGKSEGYEERQKFLDLFYKFDYSPNIKAPDIENIKAKDTVYYLFNNFKPVEIKQSPGGNESVKRNEYDIYYDGNAQNVFMQLPALYTGKRDEKFLTKNRDAIIDYNFILKYGGFTEFLSRKKVMIIEQKKNGMLRLIEVKMVLLYPAIM